ncbi:RIP metalloprotease RseP [Lutibaculum baratangense]|uniref:Zinc metalloprotease n=1 Tax=Lutibaculum baratangense AMV1 TaxID=631454 RepID=V4RDM5_9HYPH|nr:RIP metalloprotease RseP [Lutibaculum baratangense]ESR23469.1 Membrane-associated zinc metalloprotease [Lutibaculum baratangense AMV1]
MELLNGLGGFGGSFLFYALPFLFVLTVVVFFHELGHFMVARWCGVKIEAFSVGFGPELWGFTDRHGTRWKLSVIPLGGYVRFFGDENVASAPDSEAVAGMAEDDRRASFHGKGLGARAAIVAAGPIANFILAVVIFTVIFTTIGRFVSPAEVETVVPDSAAAEAGFQPGDVITAIDGRAIGSFSEMQRIVSTNPEVELTFRVDRGGEEVVLAATPELQEISDPFGSTQRIGRLGIQGVVGGSATMKRYDPFTAFVMGLGETWFVVERTGAYLAGVVTGTQAADQLGGPIRIAQVSGEVAQLGFAALLNLTAVLSISIGLLNLLPIPMLDGGHLLFYAVEAVRGRPLSARAMEIGFRVGLAFVLMLMIFATWNDIRHLANL